MLQIKVDVALCHMIALHINLMNISAVMIFFGQGSNFMYMQFMHTMAVHVSACSLGLSHCTYAYFDNTLEHNVPVHGT